MRNLRTGSPSPEMWQEADIMAHFSCDKTTAKEIMEECRKRNNRNGYGAIEKHLILDFIEEKQREQREREARYNADIATAESIAVLKEQLKQSKADSNRANRNANYAIIISFLALITTILFELLKLLS